MQTNKITGEEEDFSHIDLVDFAGNLEGAQQAFAYLKPGLRKIDPALTTQIAQRFDPTERAAGHLPRPGRAGRLRQSTPRP